MKELKIKKCLKCGALINVMKDCTCDDCGIMCCDSEMVELKPNSVDASFEKHIPSYEILDNNINIKVNHVMEDDHYIEWIAVKYINEIRTIYLNPGDNAEYITPYEKGAIIYSYCNKHGLWSKEVE